MSRAKCACGLDTYDSSKWTACYNCRTHEAWTKYNTCNRHLDCDAADAKARAKGHASAVHCREEFCEDCFGR